MGRSRGGLTTKIHALVDANGPPVVLKLTEGQAHDGRSATGMLDRLGPGCILGSGALLMLIGGAFHAGWNHSSAQQIDFAATEHLAFDEETLRKDPALTRRDPAAEAPCPQADPEPPSVSREIAQGPQVAAMNRGGRQAARGAAARPRRSTSMNRDAIGADLVMVDDQSGRIELERRRAIMRSGPP